MIEINHAQWQHEFFICLLLSRKKSDLITKTSCGFSIIWMTLNFHIEKMKDKKVFKLKFIKISNMKPANATNCLFGIIAIRKLFIYSLFSLPAIQLLTDVGFMQTNKYYAIPF